MYTLSPLLTVLTALAATSGLIFNAIILIIMICQRRMSSDRSQSSSNMMFLLNLAIVDILFCLNILFASAPISFSMGSTLASISLLSTPKMLNPSSPSTSFTYEQSSSDLLIAGPSSSPTLSSSTPMQFSSSPLAILLPQDSPLYIVSQVQGFLWTALPIIFVWTVTGLTIDKYMAISEPLHYSRRVTTKRALIFIFISWLIGLSLATLPLTGVCMYAFSPYRSSNSVHCDNNSASNMITNLLGVEQEWINSSFVIIYPLLGIIIPLVAITCCNFHMLLIAENHRHRMNTPFFGIIIQGGGGSGTIATGLSGSSTSSSASSTPTGNSVPCVHGPVSRTKSSESLTKRRARDTFLPVSQLIGPLMLFTLPSYILFMLESLYGISIHPLVISLATFCLTLMPTINAYTYGVRLLRESVKRLLHRYFYTQDCTLEIERRQSVRSQSSLNSCGYRYPRRSSCPILANTSSRSRVDMWLSHGSPTLRTPLRRQSLCLIDDNSCKTSKSSLTSTHLLQRALNIGNGIPSLKLFQADSIVKLSPIEEQATSCESV
ncbi:uncharacterized protein LOC141855464 [Brevipalpus obovatus]|uniref:uncharacterized protein LOC141855464 n=1 Tax=Brevipalpus obovatus TaxID=246614 RepID=UPI003D9F9C87